MQFGTALGQALLSGLWIGAVVAFVGHVYVRANRGLNAASRHVAWYGALVVIAALPFVSFAASLAHVRVTTMPVVSEALPAVIVASTGGVVAELPNSAAGPAAAAAVHGPGPSSLSGISAMLQPEVLQRAGLIVAAALAAIAAARIAMLIVGLLGLARVKRASRVVDPSLAPTLARTMARDRGARSVHVRISETLDAPAAAGFRTPAILLPSELV